MDVEKVIAGTTVGNSPLLKDGAGLEVALMQNVVQIVNVLAIPAMAVVVLFKHLLLFLLCSF